MIMEEILESLGLTKNESKIYIYLLKKGKSTTGPIIKNTGITNSRVYESTNTLVKKGLITYTVQKQGKYFEAAEPQKFLDLEEERKEKIESILPTMIKLKNTGESTTTSAVYEGFEGFKTSFKKIIDDCPVNGTIYIIGFSEQQYALKSLRTFITNMNLKSQQKKHKLKLVLDEKVRNTFGKDREKEKNTEVRYMPKEFVSPAAIDITDEYVYIFLWEEKPFVFMIKNIRIVESFKQYFNMLWSMSKK
jgi:sugar-specific transcriptional regulator TrmB